MKMKNQSTVISVLLTFVVVSIASCTRDNSSHHQESDAHHQHEPQAEEMETGGKPEFAVDGEFQAQLSALFSSYVQLKEAFVASDPEKVKAEAEKTRLALGNVDMKLLSGAAHHDWMTYLGNIESALQEMKSSSDIETQRESFSALSDNLFKSIRAFGMGGKEAYYAFCPMAFNNEGGYWLSDQETIRNPYFGDQMLTCGAVEMVLR